MSTTIRTFYDLSKFKTFKERYEYLKLTGEVGKETFGFDRYLNQLLYESRRWAKVRNEIILRDNGCDLGLSDYPIKGRIIIHHMNPISEEDIAHNNSDIFDPDFLICTSHITHLAIHYGDEKLLPSVPVERYAGDTVPWRNHG